MPGKQQSFPSNVENRASVSAEPTNSEITCITRHHGRPATAVLCSAGKYVTPLKNGCTNRTYGWVTLSHARWLNAPTNAEETVTASGWRVCCQYT